eukprot:SAG31_NODE_45737_length_257_cov_1.265823_1_plen_33_part_10
MPPFIADNCADPDPANVVPECKIALVGDAGVGK